MPAEPAPPLSITLSPAQLREAAGAEDDGRLSRSLLRGLALLAGFGPATPERGVVELAAELRLSASTAHRYVLTLVEAGLLERMPRTRRYRLADAPAAPSGGREQA